VNNDGFVHVFGLTPLDPAETHPCLVSDPSHRRGGPEKAVKPSSPLEEACYV